MNSAALRRAVRSRSIRSTTVSLIEALSSIPLMEPGDNSFSGIPTWSMRLRNEHRGSDYSNVMYISSTPGCAKNTA